MTTKNVGKTSCGIEELAILVVRPRSVRTSRWKRLQMQSALQNQRRFLNLVCLLLLFIDKKHHSQLLVQFVPFVGFFKIHFFFIFSLKLLVVRHPTVCFLTRYALIVFKYGVPHTEVVYIHPASIFHSLEARGKPYSLSDSSRFYTKDALIKNQKQTTVITCTFFD